MPKMNGHAVSIDRRDSDGSSNSSSNGDMDQIINGMNGLPRTRRRSSSIPELIARKRDGGSFSEDEIDQLVSSVVNKEIQDSQLGALLMAIFLKGMSISETIRLTNCMMESGDVMEWPEDWRDIMVDKHSTGGVGDKVSLPLAPALAACGVKVPMISGRGLGFTGGTLDKLESIEGFIVSQSSSSMINILDKVGCCIVGQTEKLVPADRIMYAIRDVTSTTESIPLIAGSIISKKAAENLSGLVLDVKFGKGAFLKSYQDAKELAKTLVYVSNGIGINTTAVLSNMNNPLGKTIGNALEVGESIQCLHGKGPKSLRKLVTTLGGQLLFSVNKAKSIEEGVNKIAAVLEDGSAIQKFIDMIIAQGAEPAYAQKLCSASNNPFNYLPRATFQTDLKATKSGYVHSIDALSCAHVSGGLGAGRTRAGQKIDLEVGLELHVEIGDSISEGERWITVHHNSDLSEYEDLIIQLEEALDIQNTQPSESDYALIKEIITE